MRKGCDREKKEGELKSLSVIHINGDLLQLRSFLCVVIFLGASHITKIIFERF